MFRTELHLQLDHLIQRVSTFFFDVRHTLFHCHCHSQRFHGVDDLLWFQISNEIGKDVLPLSRGIGFRHLTLDACGRKSRILLSDRESLGQWNACTRHVKDEHPPHLVHPMDCFPAKLTTKTEWNVIDDFLCRDAQIYLRSEGRMWWNPIEAWSRWGASMFAVGWRSLRFRSFHAVRIWRRRRRTS